MGSEVDQVEQRIIKRLRALRIERGLTLEKVAIAAEVSSGYLSRVESGSRVPSIGTLVMLARALGVSVADLAAEPHDNTPIMRASEAPRYGAEDAETMHLSPPRSGSVIEATQLVLRGSATPQRPNRHGGEEWLHVVSGTLELILDGVTSILEPGDSAQFPGATEHVLRGHPDAEVIVVIASPRAENLG